MATKKITKKTVKEVLPPIKPVLILRWWEFGIQETDNFRETELDMDELDMGLDWAKKLEDAGNMPLLYSKTYDGQFKAYHGSFYKEQPKKKTNRKKVA